MPQLRTLHNPRHRLLPLGAIQLDIAVLAALVSPVAADLASAAVGDPAGTYATSDVRCARARRGQRTVDDLSTPIVPGEW